MVYKTLVLTGLRRGELASIIVGQLLLEEVISGLELKAKEEKNREGSFIALRSDLPDDFRDVREVMTGTDSGPSLIAPTVAPNSEYCGQNRTITDQNGTSAASAKSGGLPLKTLENTPEKQARPTGLEPATTGSTVRYSNQLSYGPIQKWVSPDRFQSGDVGL